MEKTGHAIAYAWRTALLVFRGLSAAPAPDAFRMRWLVWRPTWRVMQLRGRLTASSIEDPFLAKIRRTLASHKTYKFGSGIATELRAGQLLAGTGARPRARSAAVAVFHAPGRVSVTRRRASTVAASPESVCPP